MISNECKSAKILDMGKVFLDGTATKGGVPLLMIRVECELREVLAELRVREGIEVFNLELESEVQEQLARYGITIVAHCNAYATGRLREVGIRFEVLENSGKEVGRQISDIANVVGIAIGHMTLKGDSEL